MADGVGYSTPQESERGMTIGRAAVALLASVLLLGVGIGAVPPAALVAARSLMFSDFLPDDAMDEGRLDELLRKQNVAGADARQYRQLVDAQAYGHLSRFAEQHEKDGTGLAREILLRMSPGRPIGGCGAESLEEKVALVADRRGCCSDYAAAFQVYAGALGLPARRVETRSHTTNEYFDRQTGGWVWLDAMYRVQAADSTGRLLSFYQLRERILGHERFHIVDLSDASIAPPVYHILFDATYFAISYWYPPSNLIAMNEFDAEWRRFHVVRPVRQFLGQLWRVRPEPTALA